MENLQMSTDSYGAVLRYGDKVLASKLVWIEGVGQVSDARVYRLAEEPIPGVGANSRGFVECELELVAETEEHFEDTGHAIAWAIAHA